MGNKIVTWTVTGLVNHSNSCAKQINGKWVPARPVSYYTVWERFQRAWLVFRDKADIFTWPEGQ